MRRYSSSRRWCSSSRFSPEQRLKTSTCCPHLKHCKRTSRPFPNRTASRYWYASALNCTNVTSSVACTSNCRCRSLGISHKSKRAPGGTQTAGVCLDQNRHQDGVGDVRPRVPVYDSSEHTLGFAFAESKHQPTHDNRHQAQAARDRCCEGILQHRDGIFP